MYAYELPDQSLNTGLVNLAQKRQCHVHLSGRHPAGPGNIRLQPAQRLLSIIRQFDGDKKPHHSPVPFVTQALLSGHPASSGRR